MGYQTASFGSNSIPYGQKVTEVVRLLPSGRTAYTYGQILSGQSLLVEISKLPSKAFSVRYTVYPTRYPWELRVEPIVSWPLLAILFSFSNVNK